MCNENVSSDTHRCRRLVRSRMGEDSSFRNNVANTTDHYYPTISRNAIEAAFHCVEYHSDGLDAAEFQLNRSEALNSLIVHMCHEMFLMIKPCLAGKKEAPKVLLMNGA